MVLTNAFVELIIIEFTELIVILLIRSLAGSNKEKKSHKNPDEMTVTL